jgi:acetylglutamate synthase
MKITESRLKQVIKEETRKVLSELDPSWRGTAYGKIAAEIGQGIYEKKKVRVLKLLNDIERISSGKRRDKKEWFDRIQYEYEAACRSVEAEAEKGTPCKPDYKVEGDRAEEWIQFAAGSMPKVAKRLRVLYKSSK